MQEFTLTINREPTEHELDRLTETELEAFGIEGPATPVTAEVAVDADTLAAAIATAVHAFESIGVAVTGVQTEDTVSLKDIAARMGRTYESVRRLASGQRGPGRFPAPFSTDSWALYSWAEVSAWLAAHYGTEGVPAYDREIVAADYLLRARHMLVDDPQRANFAQLASA